MTTVCGSLVRTFLPLMRSSAGSAIGSVPADSVAVVNTVLWLPEDLNVMGASIIEKEEDRTHAIERNSITSKFAVEICVLATRTGSTFFEKS